MALPLENIDIETVTLGELAKIYTREQELKTPLSLGSLLKKYENTPAIDVFKEEGGVPSIAKQVMRNAQAEGASDSVQKSALKTLRYLSNRIYNAYPSDPPAFLVPNEKNNPKSAIEFFGIKEPAKAVSMLQVSTDEEVIGDFVKQLIQYGYKNPEKMPHVRAIMFGMNTGLRPNASLGVKVKEYNPEKGALYIPATETGAKGRAISIPLSNMADAMLQQVLTRPREYGVLATRNLNGDYISDALAAQVGGIGIAPGANINYDTGIAIFEATHGTAPKYTGQDKVNPGSLILSAEMMLRHMGWGESADLIIKGMEGAISAGTVTYDFERLMEGATLLSCSGFGDAIISHM